MTITQIQQACKTVEPYAHKTPIMSSSTLDKIVGGKTLLKCENFQRVGAFKFRGAINSVVNLSAEEKSRGVLAYSSGNHAQAVALAARLNGVKATIIMPDTASAIKRQATKAYGATVLEYDEEKITREEFSAQIIAKEGYKLIPPFDSEHVIAGQGTATAEFFDQVGKIDAIITPCGGGGLLSGSAIIAKHLNPECKVFGVEPELADDATRSFRTGTLQTVRNPATIADGARTPSLGQLTFPLILQNVDDMITVSEEQIMQAVHFLFYRMKLVVETSGALGVAALLSGALQPVPGVTGVIISGGNIDGDLMSKILTNVISDNWQVRLEQAN